MAPAMIDPALFDQLKESIEKDGSIRKDLEQIIEELNQNVSYTQGVLTKIHSTPRSKCKISHAWAAFSVTQHILC